MVEDSEDSSPELGESGVSTSSSSLHSARSRSMDSWAIGEADRYEVLNGERAIEPCLLLCCFIGRGGVDIMSQS
jgi:hypothetical protein